MLRADDGVQQMPLWQFQSSCYNGLRGRVCLLLGNPVMPLGAQRLWDSYGACLGCILGPHLAQACRLGRVGQLVQLQRARHGHAWLEAAEPHRYQLHARLATQERFSTHANRLVRPWQLHGMSAAITEPRVSPELVAGTTAIGHRSSTTLVMA